MTDEKEVLLNDNLKLEHTINALTENFSRYKDFNRYTCSRFSGNCIKCFFEEEDTLKCYQCKDDYYSVASYCPACSSMCNSCYGNGTCDSCKPSSYRTGDLKRHGTYTCLPCSAIINYSNTTCTTATDQICNMCDIRFSLSSDQKTCI